MMLIMKAAIELDAVLTINVSFALIKLCYTDRLIDQYTNTFCPSIMKFCGPTELPSVLRS